jgi:hypothetical protein
MSFHWRKVTMADENNWNATGPEKGHSKHLRKKDEVGKVGCVI